jgi:hypothetical protein
MSNTRKRLTLGALTLSVGLLTAGAVSAADTKIFNADTDAGVTDNSVPGYSELPLVGEWRIGDRGGSATHELKVGTNTGTPSAFNDAQFPWVSGESVDFSLTYDGTNATATLGTSSVSFAVAAPSSFDALLIRTATPGTETSVVLSNLELVSTLGGTLLSNGSITNDWDSDQVDGDRLIKWLGVSKAGDLASGFSLTGDVTLSWTGSAPTQSNLAFQVKAADGPNEVPVPATLALLGLGLAGLGVIGARRKRA